MLKNFDIFSPNSILVKDLDFPLTIQNSLHRMEIETLQDLFDVFRTTELDRIRNIGVMRVDIINNSIENFLNNHYKCFPIIIGFEGAIEKITDNKNFRHHLENILFDLPLELIPDFCNELNLLLEISEPKIIVGDLGLIPHLYDDLQYPEDQLIEAILNTLHKRVIEFIQLGKFSPKLYINYQNLNDIMKFTPDDSHNKIKKIIFYKNLLMHKNLNHEIIEFFTEVSDRNKRIFLGHYIEKKSLNALGKEFNLTYSGIRNALQSVKRIFQRMCSRHQMIYYEMGLIIAKNFGSEISRNEFRRELIKLDILTDNKIMNNIDPFDLYTSILGVVELNPYHPGDLDPIIKVLSPQIE